VLETTGIYQRGVALVPGEGGWTRIALAVMVSELGAAVPKIRSILPGWISAAVAERTWPPVVSTRRKAVDPSTRAVKVEEPACKVTGMRLWVRLVDLTEPEVNISPF
jgi:hypothetical protein